MQPDDPSPEHPASDDLAAATGEAADAPAEAGRTRRGWRGLGLFWAGVLGVLAVGGVTLQVLGPPAGSPAATTSARGAGAPPPAMLGRPGQTAGGPATGEISAPDPALLEPMPDDPSSVGLPRIGANGLAPMQRYAARFDQATKLPRIAILIGGVGLDAEASEAAMRALPAEVTLAISPYAEAPEITAYRARQTGHEYLISIPMEPQGYALNDPGRRALLTAASVEDNARRLDWVLSRVAGYVGATGALGEMRGERFAAVPDQIDPVLATLAARGLLYVDPRPGAAQLTDVWSRTVDVVIDDPPSADQIDARLAELEKRAHDTGAALGLIGAIRPGTIEHLAAWVGNLAGRGYALAPVSAIVVPPAGTGPQARAPQ